MVDFTTMLVHEVFLKSGHSVDVANNAIRELEKKSALAVLDDLIETMIANTEFLAFGQGDEFKQAIDLIEDYRSDYAQEN